MNKQPKKLMLSRETVRNLAEAELAQVAGGVSTSCPSYDFICKSMGTSCPRSC